MGKKRPKEQERVRGNSSRGTVLQTDRRALRSFGVLIEVDQLLQAFDRQLRRRILVTFMMSRGRAGKIWGSGEEFDTFHY